MKSKLLLSLLVVIVAVATMSYDIPKGWQRRGNPNYFVGTVPGAGEKGKACATIKSLNSAVLRNVRHRHNGSRRLVDLNSYEYPNAFTYGELMQNIDGTPYRGQRVRLTGFMRAEDVSGSAGLWMHVGGAYCSHQNYAHNDVGQGDHQFSDFMNNRPIVGTEGWTKCEIVIDIPDGASSISYGARLYGSGQIWFENFRIERVSRNTPTTGLPNGHNWKPRNLNFQEK